MKYIFDMKVNPYTGTAEISLNGQMISPQSQLRVCAIDHISRWYRDLPQLLYSEVNDVYSLKIQCVEIEYMMFTVVFANFTECTDLSYSAPAGKYDSETRCRWLSEAAGRMNYTLQDIPAFSVITASDAASYRASVLNQLNPFIRKKCTDHQERVNVILTTSNSYQEGQNMVLSEDDIIFIIDPANMDVAVDIGSCMAVRTNVNKTASLIDQWIELTILYPYMMFCYSQLMNSAKTASFYVRSRIEMLIREEPVVECRMPAKMECGLSEQILYDEFPTSNLTVQSSDPSIAVVQNGTVTALKTGSAQLEIISETGTILCRHSMSVYFVPRVTAISLTVVNGSSVLQGSQFVVQARYSPSNAVNISSARWTYSPAGALKIIGSGRFEAVSPGNCTVTVQVGSAAQSIAVQVIPLPKQIRMVSEIRMKVNASPTPFHAVLEPAGSGCKSISVRVTDTSVAQWNQNTKSVVAVNEGDTMLEVSALDAAGNTAVRQYCKITILPEKDIITPPTYPTIIIVCAIIALITASTVMLPMAALCGAIVSVLEIVQNIQPIFKHNGTTQNKIELGIGIAGVIAGILGIIWYAGLI